LFAVFTTSTAFILFAWLLLGFLISLILVVILVVAAESHEVLTRVRSKVEVVFESLELVKIIEIKGNLHSFVEIVKQLVGLFVLFV
jgi:hypothetical protein